jgi:hypothetical protein
MSMRVLFLLVVLFLVPHFRHPALGQVARAAAGGAVGVAGGAVITLSVIVARARWQGVYLDSADDLIHWQSAPMIFTPAVGVFVGLAGKDPLVASVIGSSVGMAAGVVAGAGLGWMLSSSQEWPWAGGVIGAGVGMTIGGLTLGTRALLRQQSEGTGEAPAARIGVRLPL